MGGCMNKKFNLKKVIIILIFINIIYLVIFGVHLIRQTWLVKQNGNTYYLTQSLHNYKLSKISNIIIPIEISSETFDVLSDYINNLKAKAINITSIYRIIEIIQLIIILVLVIYFKTLENTNNNINS